MKLYLSNLPNGMKFFFFGKNCPLNKIIFDHYLLEIKASSVADLMI